MRVLDPDSTDHEELHFKLQRIPGEAWGGYGALPVCKVSGLATGDVAILPRRRAAAHEEWLDSFERSADGTAAFRELLPVALFDAVESSNVAMSEVVRESIESLRMATKQWARLTSTKNDVLRESLQAATKASEIASLRESLRSLCQRLDELDWNDAKNDRRCELIDKQIDGTLVPAENRELEELQRQMLAYRRKVAPLPLREAQRLHQRLLMNAAEQGG